MNTTTINDERGFALPAMLLLVLVLSVLGTASLTTTGDDRSAGSSALESHRAFYAAEAGLNATLEGWDLTHFDTTIATTGDSTVIDWTTIENRCDYRVVVRKIGHVSRGYYSITSTGRGPGQRGGQRTVSIVVKARPVIPANAITVGGDLEISGNPSISGACAGAHVNGSNFLISGSVVTEGGVSATGNVMISGAVEDPAGNPLTGDDFADAQPIPDLDPMDFCGEADHFLRGGYLVDVAANDSTFILGSASDGWEYTGALYKTVNNTVAAGTICADDDIEVANNIGSIGPPPYTPVPMTLISSKSISLPGNPHIVGTHSEGILLMAGGDLKINGNGSTGSNNYEGLVYADSQCEISGTPIIRGMLVCRDAANPFGSENWVSGNTIGGDVELTYNCASFFGADPVQPIHGRAWSQVLN